MKLIEEYRFGFIKVAGEIYQHDLIITSNTIAPRSDPSSHLLTLSTVKQALSLEENVKALVVGNGESGVLQLEEGIEDYLKEKGIELIVRETQDALKDYNDLAKKGVKVVGIMHLTC
ncbi:MAG: MTH938/NDUFAF3 family protein [archaeon]